jgi:hypothetical protein
LYYFILMRVKRQRRKLRGKYSGNCLSCDAKWSKCWYIASIDNQREWETRLSKVVTPGDDEVCFQCWDAKIRTSPKRKIHFKASDLNDQSVASSSVRPNTNRHKRRVLNGGFECTIHAHNRTKDYDTSSYAKFLGSEIEPASIYEESVIFDEENAVVLLSTAFRTIPQQINDVNINFEISSYEVSDELDFSEDKAKKRGAYYCGKCGKLKKGHLCDASPYTECLSPSSTPIPIQSISIQLSPVPQHSAHSPSQLSSVDVAVAAFAQPVVS